MDVRTIVIVRDHTCLMLSEHEQIELYFDLMLEKIDFHKLLSTWDDAVKELNLSPDLYAEVKEKYSSDEWKLYINSTTWIQELMQAVFKMNVTD